MEKNIEVLVDRFQEKMLELYQNKDMIRGIIVELQNHWKAENEEFGLALGYPRCCVDEFCFEHPELIKAFGTDENDELRLKSSYIDGRYTGFIPCLEHARQITSGHITLADLINNRSSEFPDFPDDGFDSLIP